MDEGTQVEWTKLKRKGSGFSLSQQYGEVVNVFDDIAVVKKRNGHRQKIPIENLHVVGSGPNQLTKLINEMASNQE